MEFKEEEIAEAVQEAPKEPEWIKTTADFTEEDYRRHLEETKDIKYIPTEYTQDFFNKFPVLIIAPKAGAKGREGAMAVEEEKEEKEEEDGSQSIAEREQREHVKRVILIDREGDLQAGCETIDIGAQIRCFTRKTKRLD